MACSFENRDGETWLRDEINALMVQDGIEYAQDDVSAASLDSKMVQEARQFEMKFFSDMGHVCTLDRD